MVSKVYISAGSNVGDKIEFLKDACEFLNEPDGNCITNISSLYETLPYGKSDQNNFYNLVLCLHTTLDHKELFHFIKSIEEKMGRTKTVRWGPREIDLDILLFDDLEFEDEILTIPHAGLLKRDFVTEPLLEIEPEIIHPVEKKKIKDLLYLVESKTIIHKKINTFFEPTEIAE